jgi:ketosteroid isomerase-like protein
VSDDEKVTLVKRSFEALGRQDLDALREIYEPDIELLPLTGTRVESGGYQGRDGVREYFEEVEPIWESFQPYGESFHVTGDRVVVIGNCTVRGQASGLEACDAMAWVITLRGEKIASHRAFRTNEEALEYAGLRV